MLWGGQPVAGGHETAAADNVAEGDPKEVVPQSV